MATDGHRLAFAFVYWMRPRKKAKSFCHEKWYWNSPSNLSESEEPVIVEILQNQVRFTFSNVVLVSKVVDGKFPDYNRVIPAGYQKHFEVNRLLFLHTLQRASILSNEKFRGVRLILTTGNLRIVCTNSEQEEAQEELEFSTMVKRLI